MGCLSISVMGFAYDTQIILEPKNTFPELELESHNTPVDFYIIGEIPSVEIELEGQNDIDAEFTNCNEKISVQIYLVCSVSLGDDEYLQVLEGNVILIDGSFVKVLKG